MRRERPLGRSGLGHRSVSGYFAAREVDEAFVTKLPRAPQSTPRVVLAIHPQHCERQASATSLLRSARRIFLGIGFKSMSIWRSLPSRIPKDWYTTMRFDLADLSLFRHVVEAGSITARRANARISRWPPPRPASATWRTRSARALLMRGRQGVHADAGRPHPAAACPHHPARRPSGCARTSAPMRAGSPARSRVLSNTNALTEFLPEALELVPGRASACQRRSRGAAVATRSSA